MFWRINLTKQRSMTEKIQEYLKKYDLNSDGTITDEEMKRTTEILELELRGKKPKLRKKCHGLP